MRTALRQAITAATTHDLFEVLGEILDPSLNGPLGKSYREDGEYEAFMDELHSVSEAYRKAFVRLNGVFIERHAA